MIDASTLQVNALHGHTGRIRHVAFAEDDRVLLSSDSDGIVRRWELAKMPATVIDSGGAAAEKLAVAPRRLVRGMGRRGRHRRDLVVRGSTSSRARHDQGSRDRARDREGHVITGTAEGDLVWWTHEPVRAIGSAASSR